MLRSEIVQTWEAMVGMSTIMQVSSLALIKKKKKQLWLVQTLKNIPMTEWGWRPNKMGKWERCSKARWNESLFPRTDWLIDFGEAQWFFETMSLYTTYHISCGWKEQRHSENSGDSSCLFYHLWIKSNIKPCLLRDSHWCKVVRLLKPETKWKDCVWPWMKVDETPREQLSGQLCRRTPWLRH